MVIHICSWFGDIEIMALPNDRARVRWLKLIPHEKKALKQFFKAQGLKVKLDAEGTTEVDLSAVGVCTLLSPLLHSGKQAITAIKFSTGEVEVTDKPVAAVIKDDAAGVDAVVQVQKPARGCPMPSATEMKEVRAAYVVRKFLASCATSTPAAPSLPLAATPATPTGSRPGGAPTSSSTAPCTTWPGRPPSAHRTSTCRQARSP